MNVATDVATPMLAWSAWNMSTALVFSHLPVHWFARRRANVRLRLDGPRRSRSLRRRWARLLPDAGTVIPGGYAKRRLPRRDRPSLERHAAEARRSEVVHWLSLAFAAACLAWWPFVVVGPMFAVGLLINVPCVVTLRDTRQRIHRLLDRHQPARSAPVEDVQPAPDTERPLTRLQIAASIRGRGYHSADVPDGVTEAPVGAVTQLLRVHRRTRSLVSGGAEKSRSTPR
jgi:glycosyl-4,4'-diaponeurosporenoate acyltransferase